MPFNGSGVFNRVYSWQADKAAGIDITASRTDADTNDITSNGLSNCLTRDGQGSAMANLPMNGFRHTGAGPAVNPTDYVTLSQITTANITTTGSVTAAALSNAGGNPNPITANIAGWTINPSGSAGAYSPSATVLNMGIPANGTFVGFFNGTTTAVGSIQVSGGVTVYNTTSDETLKDYVAPLTSSGSIIDRLQALWYRWKDRPDSTPEPGFFAQAVHRVFPWAVTPGDGEKPWQMDAGRLMPVVVAELQALRQRVADLEAR